MRALAVDLGATFVKSALIDLESFQLSHIASVPFPAFLALPHERREVDPEAIVGAVAAAIDRLVAIAPEAEALFLCGQMHGVVLTDSAGRALGAATTWQDSRSRHDSFDRLLARLGPRRAALGGELTPGHPIAVLHHLAEAGALPAEAATPLPLADFVLARLRGAPGPIEATSASAHGAYDVAAGRWHREAIALAGLEALEWPAIVPSGALIGELDWHGTPLRCHTPIGDQQAALLGALLGPGEISINVGTGSQVSVRAPAPNPGPWQVRPYPGGGYLRTITHLPAGRALNVLYGLVTELAPDLAPEAAWRMIEEKARAADPGRLQATLSFFPCRLGETGALIGIEEGRFGVGALFAATIDAMADAYAEQATSLGAAARPKVLSGGVAHRLRLLRERIGGPQRMSPCPEETLLGLMALALVATGRFADGEAARAHLMALDARGHAWLGAP